MTGKEGLLELRASCLGAGPNPAHIHLSPTQAAQDLGSGTEGSGCLCSDDQWSLLHVLPTRWNYCQGDERWPCLVLDSSPGPVLTEALMQESPPKFPDNVSSPSTANPQEDERVPHVQDFLAVPAPPPPAAAAVQGTG